jgi:hypothetical protein
MKTERWLKLRMAVNYWIRQLLSHLSRSLAMSQPMCRAQRVNLPN